MIIRTRYLSCPGSSLFVVAIAVIVVFSYEIEALCTSPTPRHRLSGQHRNLHGTVLHKKRKSRNDGEDPDQWYEAVDVDASADDGTLPSFLSLD